MDPISLLKHLPGVLEVYVLSEPQKKAVSQLEAAESTLNYGVKTVLQRQHVVVLLKDARFRKAQSSTVLLVERCDASKADLDMFGHHYIIIGQEVVSAHTFDQEHEEHAYISPEFVIFPKKKSGAKEYYLLPPLPFQELEEKKEQLGIADISSSSPGWKADAYLRSTFHLSKEPAFATLLIGWTNKGSIVHKF